MHIQLGRLCRECVNREIEDVVKEVYDGDFLSYAWTTVVEDVNDVVRRRCRPFLTFDAESPVCPVPVRGGHPTSARCHKRERAAGVRLSSS